MFMFLETSLAPANTKRQTKFSLRILMPREKIPSSSVRYPTVKTLKYLTRTSLDQATTIKKQLKLATQVISGPKL